MLPHRRCHLQAAANRAAMSSRDPLQVRDRRQVSTAITNTSNVPSSARTMAGSCWVCMSGAVTVLE
jgi:hypothetical protein